MDDQLQRAPVGVLEVSPDGTVTDLNPHARELIDVSPTAAGSSIADVGPRSVEDSLLAAFDGEPIRETEFEEYYPNLERWLAVSIVRSDAGATVYIRDVTERHEHEQAVERLRAEHQRTALIDEVLTAVLGELVAASSREDIAETICTGLGETELYEFAWVGERELGGDDIVIRASAGETGATFRAVRDSLERSTTTPEERAVDHGELVVAQPLIDKPEVPEEVRKAGFGDGVQSMVAIPLAHGSNVHGVVGLYASETDAFSDRERTSFSTLGDVAGFAVTAARNRELLLSDEVTEVTFEVGQDSVLGSLSATLDAEVAIEGLVPRAGDEMLCYVTVSGDQIEDIGDRASAIEGIGDIRHIDDTETARAVEIEIVGSTPLLSVSNLGGTVRRATFSDGTGRLVVDLPRDGDVRRMVDSVTREYDASVVSKRERNRPVTTTRGFEDELNERLTERQLTVLKAAYHADYFESPRGSTAEDVAQSLDITGSTLLHHLRASQRKILDAYFGMAEDVGD